MSEPAVAFGQVACDDEETCSHVAMDICSSVNKDSGGDDSNNESCSSGSRGNDAVHSGRHKHHDKFRVKRKKAKTLSTQPPLTVSTGFTGADDHATSTGFTGAGGSASQGFTPADTRNVVVSPKFALLETKAKRESMTPTMLKILTVPAACVCVLVMLLFYTSGFATGITNVSNNGIQSAAPAFRSRSGAHATLRVVPAGCSLSECSIET